MIVIIVIKILLLAGMGLAILLLIPDLFLPIAAAIDSVLDTEFINVMLNIYEVIPESIMTLMVMQFATLAIIIIIRFVVGAKK